MNRKFAVIISIATFLLIGLLIALSIFRSSSQSTEQSTITEVVIPTTSPNNQSLSSTSSSIKSNDEVQLNTSDTSAIDNTIKKLPIDSAELKVEYSEQLDTFYIQNTSTDEARLNQFLEENNLSNLYKTNPKFFKFTNQKPKYVMDEDEFTFISGNGLGESQSEISLPATDQQKQLEVAKGLLGIIFNLEPPPIPTIRVNNPNQPNAQLAQPPVVGLQPTSTANSVNTANCANVIGNEKIVCSALKYTGIRYGYAANARGNKLSKDRWGIVSQGSNGHGPATWIAQRIPGGSNDFLECSGYVAVAIYDAFGVVEDRCSTAYYGAKNFKKIDINTARAGDLLIKGTGCATSGGGGHIGIFVKRNPNGTIQTLESTPRGSGKSGYYDDVSPTYFTHAVRYTGPGSTP